MPTRTSAQRRTDRDLLRIATFILFDAAVYHEGLTGTIINLRSLRKATSPIQTFLTQQWNLILRENYEPVFGLASEVLDAFPTSPDTESILREIIDAAINVVASGVLLRHDFMGRVYHRLLLHTTAHYYATYYTSIPAAWLLANLALKTPHPSWDFSSLDAISRFRFIDPACGSGTLLSAAYMATKDLYILSRPASLDLDALHKLLVEQVVHGWDILDYASHLTLTTLSLHSNRVRVRDSNVLTLPAGVDQNGVHLGSLDVLSQTRAIPGKGFTTPAAQHGMEGSRERQIVPHEEFGKYDLVIMNPPFSRSAKPNTKFGYSSPDVRKQMAHALRTLTEEMGVTGIGHAGLGAYFMLLALRLTKPDGRIAVVIPRAMLSGVSWRRVRRDYLQNCEIEYIVSNYDPGSPDEGIEGWNWSENTDLGEVLVVARKTAVRNRDRFVVYVNLWRKPKNEVEALLVSHQTVRARASLTDGLDQGQWRPISLRGQTVGCAYRVAHDLLDRNWLTSCVFADPSVNALVLECLKPTMPCVPLRAITTHLGVDIKQVKDHFAQSDRRTTYPIVWGHQATMNTIRLAEQNVGWGRAKGKASAALHQNKASNLLIAERPHLSTEALLAMLAPTAVLTTAFWEVRPSRQKYALPILLWMNSTYGILQYLACATSSMGDIFKMKKDQIQDMPVVDPQRLHLQGCRTVYRGVEHQVFLPFAQEFERAAQGAGPRWALDEFLRGHLPLPQITAQHYELLARDPILTKRRA
jgi:hypothetical protein